MGLSDRNDPSFVGNKEGWLACAPMILLGIALSVMSWVLSEVLSTSTTLLFLVLFGFALPFIYRGTDKLPLAGLIVSAELLWIGHGVVLLIRYFS